MRIEKSGKRKVVLLASGVASVLLGFTGAYFYHRAIIMKGYSKDWRETLFAGVVLSLVIFVFAVSIGYLLVSKKDG